MAKFIQFGGGRSAETGGPQPCVQCEAMLADALDGTLSTAEQEQFDLHVASCAACSQMLTDAQRGAAWLELLKTPRPEPSPALFERILAQTADSDSLPDLTPTASSHQAATILPFQNRAVIGNTSRLQPRLALTAAMAFFSVGLTLNLTGVRLNELHASDLKPSSVRRNLYQANAHVVRYVDNMRVVYELESRVHDLQQGDDDGLGSSNRAPAEDHTPAPTQQQEHKQPRPRPGSGTSKELAPADPSTGANFRLIDSPTSQKGELL